jgi:hypothetical protein
VVDAEGLDLVVEALAPAEEFADIVDTADTAAGVPAGAGAR